MLFEMLFMIHAVCVGGKAASVETILGVYCCAMKAFFVSEHVRQSELSDF